MSLIRKVYDDTGNVTGLYLANPYAEITFYDIKGNPVTFQDMPYDVQNFLDILADGFEDEPLRVEDGYEVLGKVGVDAHTLKRKIVAMYPPMDVDLLNSFISQLIASRPSLAEDVILFARHTLDEAAEVMEKDL